MKAVALFSGGKDSFLSALIAMEQGLDVQYCITIDPEEYSMMFHYPNTSYADLAAQLLGVTVRHVREENFRNSLEKCREEGIEAVVSGAIASEYQKTRIEHICTDLGLISYTPLWRKDQLIILNKVVESGMTAVIVSVSAEGLLESDLGSRINSAFISRMLALNESIRINLAGEGGEYESFVTSLTGHGSIIIDSFEKTWKGSGGYLTIKHAHYIPG